MRRREEDSTSNLTIVDAVETLSNIADLDPERDIGAAEKNDVVVLGKSFTYRTVHWLQQTDADTTLDVIKDTFRVVLRYLRSFYKEEYGYLTDAQTVEGIKTIMVLVGEAAKKLDRFTKLFHGAKAASVTNLKEYKQLQEFYQKRIARKIDEGTLGKWVLALTAPRVSKDATATADAVGIHDETRKVFVDLDVVKKDIEYELFFLRKDDGTRFFSPSLLRNVRLVCDFGDYFGEDKRDDPLGRLDIWQDWMYQISARSILRVVKNDADDFYRHFAGDHSQALVSTVNYALMALLMAANPRNLSRNRPVKSCTKYYVDFQNFLREALTSLEYQKLVTYPPRKTNRLAWSLVNTINTLCDGLYMDGVGYSEMAPVITSLVEKARQVAQQGDEDEDISDARTWWELIASDYAAMGKLMRRHPNGPLYKVLEYLKEDGHQFFDPIVQNNIPNRWYDLQVGESIIENVRLPSPIRQDFIHKAVVNDEFKAALRNYKETHERGHLLFNLEDSTSWLEHSRCEVLERLQDKGDFANHLRVVTFATNTDFYNQTAPYHEASHADVFMEQLKDQITGEGGGYFFPESMREVLFTSFLPQLVNGLHEMFFGGKNTLVRRERLDFIQLVQLLLALKIIELIKPETFSFTCKDGVDCGSAFSAMVFACLKLFHGEEMDQRDLDYLYVMFFGPALIIRERTMLPERFNRALGAIKVVAQAQEEHGISAFRRDLERHLQPLFATQMLDAAIAIPQPVQILY